MQREETFPREDAFGVGRELHVNARDVRRREQAAAADDGEHHADGGDLAQLGLDEARGFVHRAEARALDGGEADGEFALVGIAGEIFLPNGFVERIRGRDDAQREHRDGEAMMQRKGEHRGVRAVEPAVETAARAGVAVRAVEGIVGLQEPRAHHRREREGDEQTHHHRDGGGDAELKEEAP